MSLFYFAYGSNMSPQRLQARVPSAEPVAMTRLGGHQLRFHKVSRFDGSAKCDAWYTGDPDHTVYGLIYRMAADEKLLLDRCEGLGQGYEIKHVSLKADGEESVNAFFYYATDIQSGLQPYDWYKEHVLAGARFAGLPAPYLNRIAAVEACPDPEHSRRNRELAIYRR